jgi:hypothetical protein
MQRTALRNTNTITITILLFRNRLTINQHRVTNHTRLRPPYTMRPALPRPSTSILRAEGS